MKSQNRDLADMAEQLKKKAKKGEVLPNSFTEKSIMGPRTVLYMTALI